MDGRIMGGNHEPVTSVNGSLTLAGVSRVNDRRGLRVSLSAGVLVRQVSFDRLWASDRFRFAAAGPGATVV